MNWERPPRHRAAPCSSALRGRLARPLAASAIALLVGGCTVAKPLVCTFTTPARHVAAAFSSRELDEDDADAKAEEIPTPLFCLAAPIVLPVRIVERMVNGFVGGLFTGIASDLNVVLGHSEHPTKNLTFAWQTNATTPSESP